MRLRQRFQTNVPPFHRYRLDYHFCRHSGCMLGFARSFGERQSGYLVGSALANSRLGKVYVEFSRPVCGTRTMFFESRRGTGRQIVLRVVQRSLAVTGKLRPGALWRVSGILFAAAPARILLQRHSPARGTRPCRERIRLQVLPERRNLQNHRMGKLPTACSGTPIVVLRWFLRRNVKSAGSLTAPPPNTPHSLALNKKRRTRSPSLIGIRPP